MGDDKNKKKKPKIAEKLDEQTRKMARQGDNVFSGGKSNKVTRIMRKLIGDDPSPHG
jgi:hypothetical protein